MEYLEPKKEPRILYHVGVYICHGYEDGKHIMLGLMAHSSSNPCSWFNNHKNDSKNKGEQRKFGSTRSMFWTFSEQGRKASQAKKSETVIHPPIFENTDETLILYH